MLARARLCSALSGALALFLGLEAVAFADVPRAGASASPAAPAAPSAAPASSAAPSAPSAAPSAGPAPSAAPEAAPAPSPAEEAAAAAKRDQARVHFEKGVELFRDGAWAPALAEFLESRGLYPTKSATLNAAVCLRKLERFDEALDMYGTLLHDFPNLTPEDKTAAQQAIVELRGLVGTVDVDGAELGASIAIDGHDRGDYPPTAPLRVPSGSHVVRIYKEGFQPFEVRVDVAGGQTRRVEAHMRRLTLAGRLKVREESGKTLEVVVDNVVVGKTPWDGPVAEGEHTVLLRGEGSLGTAPATAPVKLQQITTLTLRAEELGGSLRIDPTPPAARVFLDGVPLGRGVWEGRVRTGAHQIDVSYDRFLPQSRRVTLTKGQRESVVVELQRDPEAFAVHRPSKIFLEVQGGLPLVPTYGGDAASGCDANCSAPLGLGAFGLAHFGYERPSGAGVGLAVGYFASAHHIEGRSAQATPVGMPAATGSVEDRLRLQGLLVGATGFLHFGDRFPLLLRLGVGALIGSIDDQRRGTFAGADTGYALTSVSSAWLHIDPEVRIGMRFGAHVELSAGVQALVLVALTQPRWDATQRVPVGSAGLATYGDDTLSGRVVVLPAPSIGARYEF